MAVYGTDLYGTQLYGPVGGGLQFVASGFDAECLDYGTVDVSWGRVSGGFTRQRLLRSTIGPSYDQNDGVILYDYFSGYPQSWHDTGLTGGVWYYYTLFVFDSVRNIWIAAGTAGALCVTNYGQTDQLYAHIPNVFKSPDLQAIGNSNESTNTSLYRFLSITGFEHDRIRTELNALSQLKDPKRCPAQFLPMFAQEMGISFEPELGIRSVRRWLANAVHLFHIKGTSLCARDLVSVLTGWSANVSIGKNLALNDPTAEQIGGIGVWRTQFGVDLIYRANDTILSGVVGEGVVEARVTGAADDIARVGLFNLGDRSRDQALTGIQVVQGRQYSGSMFFRASRENVSVTMSMIWVDRDGNPLGTVDGDPVTIDSIAFDSRPFVTAIAPAGAAYALIYWSATGTIGNPLVFNDYIWSNGFQFELGATPSDTVECARKLFITIRGDAFNAVLNPTGVLGTDGWDLAVGELAAETDSDTGVSDFAVTTNPFGTTDVEVVNSGSFTRVSIGNTFTVLAEGQDTVERGALMAVGLQRFAGATYVDTVYGDFVALNTTQWSQASLEYSVPVGDAITHIAPVVHFRSSDGTTDLAYSVLKFRNVGLINLPASQASYFDGSTPSPTGDYMWEGTPNASRSWKYKNRNIRTARLRAILPLYLVTNKCFDFIFAPPDTELFAPLVGVENYNRNPGDPPPSPAVSADLTLEWDDLVSVGKEVGLEWDDLVFAPIPVGSSPAWVAITPDGATAYVSNAGDGTVTPIDIAARTPGTPITVGANPQGIAITPDGATAYVVSWDDATVTPIDVATNVPGTPIALHESHEPIGIAITPDGATAYVAEAFSSFSYSVIPIDLATSTPGSPITVGTQPVFIAITPDGATAYVTNEGGASVTPIDVATNTPGSPITTGSAGADPWGIAITPDGATAYVVNTDANNVVPIDVATNVAGAPIAIGDAPRAIAITPDGTTAYVTRSIGATVVPIDLATSTPGAPIAVGGNPLSVAITPDGSKVFVVNNSDNTVSVLNV